MAEGKGPAVLRPRPVVGTFAKPLTATAVAGPVAGSEETPPSSTQTTTSWSPAASSNNGGGGGSGADGGGADSGGADSATTDSVTTDSVTTDDGTGDFITPVCRAARAACGENHTVIVSMTGEAWTCGRNRAGQLGLDPEELAETASPVRVPLLLPSVPDDEGNDAMGGPDAGGGGTAGGTGGVPGGRGGGSARAVVHAAAGRAHTMLLLSNGRVVGFGSDEFGALGVSLGEEGGVVGGGGNDPEREAGGGGGEATMARSWHWKPREIAALRGQWVASVSAGGEQSFAIVVDSPPSLPPRPPAPAGATAMPPASAAQYSAGGVEPAATAAAAVAASCLTHDEGRTAVAAGPETASMATVAEADVGVDGNVSTTSSSSSSSSYFSSSSAAATASASATANAVAKAPVRCSAEEDGAAGSHPGGCIPAVATTASITRQGSEAMAMRFRFCVPPSSMMIDAGSFLEWMRRARAAGFGQEEGGSGAKKVEDAVIEVSKEAAGGKG